MKGKENLALTANSQCLSLLLKQVPPCHLQVRLQGCRGLFNWICLTPCNLLLKGLYALAFMLRQETINEIKDKKQIKSEIWRHLFHSTEILIKRLHTLTAELTSTVGVQMNCHIHLRPRSLLAWLFYMCHFRFTGPLGRGLGAGWPIMGFWRY